MVSEKYDLAEQVSDHCGVHSSHTLHQGHYDMVSTVVYFTPTCTLDVILQSKVKCSLCAFFNCRAMHI